MRKGRLRVGLGGWDAQLPILTMKKILLIKTSSLGDVIHAFPAVTDLKSAGCASRIDWVVEESLVPIVKLHPAVDDVIPVAMRRWRRAWWRRAIRDEMSDCRRRLRAQTYDDIVDAQGLIKSALIARAARGVRHGLDFHSAREPLAPFYDHTYRVPWDIHAVERTRLLLARAVGYGVTQPCDYGIRASPRAFTWLPAVPYAVLLHASSGDYKLWDEQNWKTLGDSLNSRGITCILPFGNAQERARSERLAGKLRAGVVPPALGFEALAGLLAGAAAVVGIDTGLMHLAAALGTPTVGIYNATDPAATGIYSCARAVNIGGIGGAPTAAQVIAAVTQLAP